MKPRWDNLDKSHADSAHYSVMRLGAGSGMDALREMFPNGEANDMNAVLFSTSGIHGTYNTIEEAEARVLCGDPEHIGEVTFLIVQPRRVALRYSTCEPQTLDDFAFLKKLRASSHAALASIGTTRPSSPAAQGEAAQQPPAPAAPGVPVDAGREASACSHPDWNQVDRGPTWQLMRCTACGEERRDFDD